MVCSAPRARSLSRVVKSFSSSAAHNGLSHIRHVVACPVPGRDSARGAFRSRAGRGEHGQGELGLGDVARRVLDDQGCAFDPDGITLVGGRMALR